MSKFKPGDKVTPVSAERYAKHSIERMKQLVGKPLLVALQEVIAAADGNGWDQLSPSLENQRRAVAKAGGAV